MTPKRHKIHAHHCCPTWLVILPPALGDSVLSLPIIDRIRAAVPWIEIVVASLPDMQELLGKIEGLAGAFAYDDLAGPCGERHFEWVIDLSGFEYHQKLETRGNFENVIYRDFERWDHIISRTLAGKHLIADPIFERSSRDGDFLNRLAVWLHESAPLLAHVLRQDPNSWLEDRPCPRIQWANPESWSSSNAAGEPQEVLFFPCGRWEAKKWPEGQWIELAERISSCGNRITLVLGPQEQDSCVRLRDKVNRTLICRSLVELADTIASGSVVVANDCGPLHLAAAMGKACVVIFGPTNPYKWFWYHNPCQVFVQTARSFTRGTAVKWKVDRQEQWEDWPDATEVHARVIDLSSTTSNDFVDPKGHGSEERTS